MGNPLNTFILPTGFNTLTVDIQVALKLKKNNSVYYFVLYNKDLMIKDIKIIRL